MEPNGPRLPDSACGRAIDSSLPALPLPARKPLRSCCVTAADELSADVLARDCAAVPSGLPALLRGVAGSELHSDWLETEASVEVEAREQAAIGVSGREGTPRRRVTSRRKCIARPV